jgi:hypothetical protein
VSGDQKKYLFFDLDRSFLSPLEMQRLRSTKLRAEPFNGASPGGKKGRRIAE